MCWLSTIIQACTLILEKVDDGDVLGKDLFQYLLRFRRVLSHTLTRMHVSNVVLNGACK